MRKGFFKDEENTFGNKTSSDNNFDNLDLLNLPLSFSSGTASVRDRRNKFKTHHHNGDGNVIGDDYHSNLRIERKASNHYNPSGDTSDLGQPPQRERNNKFYCAECSGAIERRDDSVLCLYENQCGFSRESQRTKSEEVDEFLIPHHKKKKNLEAQRRNQALNNDTLHSGRINQDFPEPRIFPFKTTPSGNLKINSHQVVFESDKFSVLVADPQNTKVSIQDQRPEAAMPKDTEDRDSTVGAIMKEVEYKCLGSLLAGRLADAPVRKEKESSDYEGRATHEILDPELNLIRLGYTAADSINWRKIILPEKKNLYLELYARITNFTNADCKVYIDNEEFNCHLLVLQCYSEVFHTYVAVKKVELPSEKCDPASFAFIYEWMITGDPSYRELSRENVLDIFNAAKYLKIKDLIEQCWAFIDNPQVFSEDTAFLLYIDAKDKELPEVRELMLPRIEKFFLMLVSSQDWLDLSLEDVQNFLQSNYICVNCEMEIFMSAVRWLKYDVENRDEYKHSVLSCVRFGNLAPWQLVDIKRNPDNPEFKELAKDHDICKMIDDGLAFVIIKYWYGQENEDYQHWNSILALKEPPSRNWSGTEKTYFTYREFLIYLDQYRRTQMIAKNKQQRDQILTPGAPGDSKAVQRQPSNESVSSKLPTIEQFLSTRKPTSHRNWTLSARPRLSKRQAARIIENAYLKYKIRKRVKGLAKRLSKNIRRRDNSSALRKLLDVPKTPPTNQSDQKKQQLKQASWCRRESVALRVALPSPEIKIKDMKHNRLEFTSNHFHENLLNSKRKDFVTETSLFYLEHESVLVFGGINVHNKYGIGRNTGKDIYRYLPIHNDWEYVGEMPAPRTHHCVAFLVDRIYVVGGSDPREDDLKGKFVVVDTVWSFEPVKRIWFTEGCLNVRRKNFGLVVCGKIMFAIGGQDKNSRVTDTVERYNLTRGTWEYVAPLRHPRMGIACAKFEEKIWVGGGMCGSSQRPLTDSVECYDIKNNQWTEIARLRVPRCFATFFSMSNNLYLIAGAGRNKNAANNTISFSSIDIWNKEEQVWQQHTEMEVARHGHTTAFLGTQILIIGGVTTVYMRSLSSVECFCTTRGTWIRGMSTLPNCLSGHATVTLPPAILM